MGETGGREASIGGWILPEERTWWPRLEEGWGMEWVEAREICWGYNGCSQGSDLTLEGGREGEAQKDAQVSGVSLRKVAPFTLHRRTGVRFSGQVVSSPSPYPQRHVTCQKCSVNVGSAVE